jgi:hypothetical protein
MKRFHLAGLLAVPALAVALAVVPGCSKDTTTKKTETTTKSGTGTTTTKTTETTKEGKGEAITAPTDGVIKGKVTYAGTPPPEPPIKAMEAHADKDVCLAGSHDEKVDQTWLVSKDKGVANVVVYLQPTGGKHFKVTDSMVAEAKKDNPSIDQPHCAFVPHVVAVFAAYRDDAGKLKETGQKLIIKNSSAASHNTKITGDPLKNPDFNVNISPKQEKDHEIKYQKKPLTVACDKHTWMNGKILTFDQPYFAVTKKDGTFEIKNVPTGVELQVVMWHEETGEVKGPARSFKTGENDVALEISKK